MATNSTSRPTQVIYFSHPRAACHLLERMLSKQPGVQYSWHPYASTRPAQIPLWTEDSVAAGIPDDVRKPYLAAVDQGNAAWEKALVEAKAAVRVFPLAVMFISDSLRALLRLLHRAILSSSTNTPTSHLTLSAVWNMLRKNGTPRNPQITTRGTSHLCPRSSCSSPEQPSF